MSQRSFISKNAPFLRPKQKSAKKLFGKFFVREQGGFADFTPWPAG
jgi:hypothetical protein